MSMNMDLPVSDLRLVAQQMPVGVLIHSGGAVAMANPAFLAMLGYEREDEVLGRAPLDFAHPEFRATVSGRIGSNYEGKMSPPSRQRLLRKDGSVAQVEVSGLPIAFDGKPAVMAIFRDLSQAEQAFGELKRSRDREQKLEENLRQAQKMEAIGQLAGGVAHDFNNILSAIMMNCQIMVDERGPGSPKEGDRLDEILGSCDSAVALTRQLLTFSRRGQPERLVIKLGERVAGTKKMLRRLLRESIELNLDLGPEASWIDADPGQIEQLLLNLGLNARDAMPAGGPLDISVHNLEVAAGAEAEVLELSLGPYVRLSVKDCGVGMTCELQQRIFEPFFTTKEPGKGTGMGLSTVYGIVKQHGGAIRVESRPGMGSRFDVYFPRVEGSSSEAPAVKAEELPGRGEELLLVEDEPVLRRALAMALRRKGYLVREADNAAHAFKLVQAMAKPPQALITDLVMPGMDGLKMAALLAERHGIDKAIFMSGYSDQVLREDDPAFPHAHFIRKPVRLGVVLGMLRTLLDSPA
jgi:two-component system cell cycle sensor histidine kinase/response regulator CckA